MKRPLLNLLIDLLTAAAVLGVMATGYLLYGPLPPGSPNRHRLWGLSRLQWGEVHTWLSVVLVTCVAIHLALHWQWIVTVVRRQLGLPATPKSRHLGAAIGTIAVLMAAMFGFAWLAERSVLRAPDVAGEAAPREDAPPTHQEVDAILRSACLSCHGPSRARGGFRVDRRSDFFGDAFDPPLMTPGESAKSPLVAILSGKRPEIALPDVHRLPPREFEVVRRWIDAGAPWGRGEEGAPPE